MDACVEYALCVTMETESFREEHNELTSPLCTTTPPPPLSPFLHSPKQHYTRSHLRIPSDCRPCARQAPVPHLRHHVAHALNVPVCRTGVKQSVPHSWLPLQRKSSDSVSLHIHMHNVEGAGKNGACVPAVTPFRRDA